MALRFSGRNSVFLVNPRYLYDFAFNAISLGADADHQKLCLLREAIMGDGKLRHVSEEQFGRLGSWCIDVADDSSHRLVY